MSKVAYLKREKELARARKRMGKKDDGYLKLARAIIHGPRIRPETGTKLRVRPVNPKLFKMSDGVTQSLMHSFLSCRRQFQLTLQGWRPAKAKAAMTYGSIFHDLLEHYYMGIIAGEVDRDTNFKAFAKKHTKQWITKNAKHFRHEGDVKMAHHETAKVCAVFPAYCRFHDEDFDEIDWQKLEGVFDVEWRGFRLRGRWDGLYKLHKRLWLLETKTKGNINPKDIKTALVFDFQCLYYITALALKGLGRIRGVRYNVIRNPGLKQGKHESTKKFMRRIADDAEKRNKFYFMRFEQPFGKDVRRQFEEELEMKLNEMKNWLEGRLPTYKNEGSCVRRYNCEFISACSSGTMAGYIGKGTLFTELL